MSAILDNTFKLVINIDFLVIRISNYMNNCFRAIPCIRSVSNSKISDQRSTCDILFVIILCHINVLFYYLCIDVEDTVKYLIISHNDVYPYLLDFIGWWTWNSTEGASFEYSISLLTKVNCNCFLPGRSSSAVCISRAAICGTSGDTKLSICARESSKPIESDERRIVALCRPPYSFSLLRFFFLSFSGVFSLAEPYGLCVLVIASANAL